MEISNDEIIQDDIIKSVRDVGAGAIVVFIGTVREEPGLDGLELESYKDMALAKLDELKAKTKERFDILKVSVTHRTGKIPVGENIVTIAVSAAHRADAFAACRFFIDELKMTVPIWKKELGPGTWVSGEMPKDVEVDSQKISGMVDVTDKEIVHRQATAEGFIELTKGALDAIINKKVKKGDVLEVAKIAAIAGVKQTPTIVPLCHPIPISGVEVHFELLATGIQVTCSVKADYKTGVEMEALCGVNNALLTIWDMVKYIEKDDNGQYPSTKIHDIRVISKLKEPR
jgi:cyclic pyranopterin phosphate synthase